MTGRALRSRPVKMPAPTVEKGLEDPICQSSSQPGTDKKMTLPDHTVPSPAKTPPILKRPAKQAGRSAKKQKRTDIKKKRTDIYDDTESLLQNEKSPLFQDGVSIKNILMHPKALETLSNSRAAYEAVESDTIATAAAAFKEDGALGRFDEIWIREAIAASELRASGGTLEYEKARFDEIWGCENETFTEDEDTLHSPHGGGGDDDDDDNDYSPDNRRSGNPSNGESRDDSGQPNGVTQDNISPGSKTESTHDAGAAYNVGGVCNNIPSGIQIQHAPRTQIKQWTSDIKMELLFAMPKGMWQREGILGPGDVIRIDSDSGLFKEVKVVAVKKSTRLHHSYLDILLDVPPGRQSTSDREFVRHPRAGAQIRGCVDIRNCMAAEDARLANLPAGYRDLILKRNGEVLGSLSEIRQAFSFCTAEYDFYNQINFNTNGRRRRISAEQVCEGYHVNGSCLYRKIKAVDVAFQNPNIWIDLGDTLNDGLASCANPGFVIIMVDARILGNDGIAVPNGTRHVDREGAYQNGPAAFTTPFTRELAGLYGYSLGHAHIGPLGLTKGYGQRQWNKGFGCPDNIEFKNATSDDWHKFRTPGLIAASDGCKIWNNPSDAFTYYNNQFIRSDPTFYPRFGNQEDNNSSARLSKIWPKSPKEWLDINKVPPELTPAGVAFTPAEMLRVTQFQKDYLYRKVVHRPIPRTMAHRHVPNPAQQDTRLQPVQLDADDERVHEYDTSHGYLSPTNRDDDSEDYQRAGRLLAKSSPQSMGDNNATREQACATLTSMKRLKNDITGMASLHITSNPTNFFSSANDIQQYPTFYEVEVPSIESMNAESPLTSSSFQLVRECPPLGNLPFSADCMEVSDLEKLTSPEKLRQVRRTGRALVDDESRMTFDKDLGDLYLSSMVHIDNSIYPPLDPSSSKSGLIQLATAAIIRQTRNTPASYHAVPYYPTEIDPALINLSLNTAAVNDLIDHPSSSALSSLPVHKTNTSRAQLPASPMMSTPSTDPSSTAMSRANSACSTAPSSIPMSPSVSSLPFAASFLF